MVVEHFPRQANEPSASRQIEVFALLDPLSEHAEKGRKVHVPRIECLLPDQRKDEGDGTVERVVQALVFCLFGCRNACDALSELLPEQVALIESTPQWLTGIFAIATLTGLLGSVFLLLRKSLAVSLFLISLVGVLIQMGYSFFATNALEVYGTVQGLIMPLIVIFIAFYLYFFSKRCSKQRILK